MSISRNARWLNCVGLLLLFGLAGSHVLADSKANDAGLLKYAGSYDSQALLDEPTVQASLGQLLGENLPHFLNNLNVRGSVDLISGNLSLSGNAIHGGGIEEAVLCVANYNTMVSAAIFSEGVVTVYAYHPDYTSLSLCIKDWITQVNSGHRDRLKQPRNVQIKENRLLRQEAE